MVDLIAELNARVGKQSKSGVKLRAFALRTKKLVAVAAIAMGATGCGGLRASHNSAVPGVASVAQQGVLFVGGKYKSDPTQGMIGQAFVFYQIPKDYQPGRDGKWPIIMVHGSEQTGANFLGTPDGRPGWAWYFVSKGWPVYVIDQPGHGKSGYFPEAYGPQAKSPQPARVQGLFTGPELTQPPAWPEAPLHTQWPGGKGSGRPGNEAFDQFMASQVANMPEYKQALSLTADAIGKLLEKIGPAVLLTHSMTGPVSWMVPQANPGMIKAIIAVEPTGNSSLRGDAGPGSRCGITDECLEFLPVIQGAADLGLTKVPSPIPGLQSCWLQRSPAHTLSGFKNVPVLIAVGEASYHAQYDSCTSEFLKQAAVPNTFINLASAGFKGNGHMQMLELNNLEIAGFYEKWLMQHIR